MERFPIADANAAVKLNERLTGWAASWREGGLLVEVDHHGDPDERGHYHWLVRLHGEEKKFITVWLALRQRSVHVEAEVVAAPETGHEALYRYCLVRNADLRGVHLAIGPESALYLVTAIPVNEVTADRLDELMAAIVTYVDELYPTMMAMGFAWFRRRH